MLDESMAYIKGRDYQIVERPYRVMYPLLGYEAKTNDGFVELYSDGKLVLNPGFTWDGSSVPVIKWIHKLPFINYPKDMRASGEHDAMYRLFRFGLIPCTAENLEIVDKRYCDRCVEDGMFLWRAKNRLFWLKKAGKRSTFPSSRIRVHYAP